MPHLPIALLFLPWFITTSPPAPSVVLNLSERSLNRIARDSFYANGGPRITGERARVSSRVADLRYEASLSEPVLHLGEHGSARLSMEILDATLRIGRLERKRDGSGARCEGAGVDVDPTRPLRVDVDLDFTIEDDALRIVPRNVEIADLEERLLLVGPTRCTNSLFPTWFLWWIGKPFIRRSVENLDQVLLERARRSAARLEGREEQVRSGWGPDLQLVPEVLDTSGGSLLVGLTASGGAPAGIPRSRESFLAISESLVNEVARQAHARRARFHGGSSARRLLSSEAVYALVPGLRGIDGREHLDFEVSFREAPRVAFRRLGDGQAVVRVVLAGVDLHIRHREASLGTLHIEAGEMEVAPYANPLGGISFRVVENRWRTTSTGLEFDDELVAAVLQEIAFGKIFETGYEPLLTRDLRIGETAFRPRSFSAVDGYLVIGLAERPPTETARSSADATRTEDLLESR